MILIRLTIAFFSFSGGVEFEDLESGATRLVEASAVAETYRAKIGEFLDHFEPIVDEFNRLLSGKVGIHRMMRISSKATSRAERFE